MILLFLIKLTKIVMRAKIFVELNKLKFLIVVLWICTKFLDLVNQFMLLLTR